MTKKLPDKKKKPDWWKQWKDDDGIPYFKDELPKTGGHSEEILWKEVSKGVFIGLGKRWSYKTHKMDGIIYKVIGGNRWRWTWKFIAVKEGKRFKIIVDRELE